MDRLHLGRLAGAMAALWFACGSPLAAADPPGPGAPWRVETSAYMLLNLMPDPGDYYQLSLGYRLDGKSILFLNAITWKYDAPLGIPWGPDKGSPAEDYPGYARDFGLGLSYQRFLWKGLFLSLYATPFLQDYYSADNERIGSGFQLFLQAHLGYQIDLLKGRLYLKPSVTLNYWPVNTELPSAFLLQEIKWPNYFLFEPQLYVGLAF